MIIFHFTYPYNSIVASVKLYPWISFYFYFFIFFLIKWQHFFLLTDNKSTNKQTSKQRKEYVINYTTFIFVGFFSFDDESSLIKLILLMRMIGKNKHIISLCVFLLYATYKQIKYNKMKKENKRKNKKEKITVT